MDPARYKEFLQQTEGLRERLGGVISEVFEIPRFSGYPRLFTFATESRGLPPLPQSAGTSLFPRLPKISGAGVSLEPGEAEVRAIGEAIERYCMSIYSPEQFVRASARDLGPEALDLDRLARCSPEEFGVRTGRFALPRKDSTIRWVKGVSLIDGRPLYVPAVMVYLYFPPQTPQENFWIPISTGCACHRDLTIALASGICEVIERDALAVTWLHQLSLPHLDIGDACGWPAKLQTLMSRMSESYLEYRFFDATTDLGIPTVYALQLSDHTSLLSNLVVAATRLGAIEALARTVEEGCSSRLALDASLGVAKLNPLYREKPELIFELEDCALYYAEKEHRKAFAFLLESPARRPVGEIADRSQGSPRADLGLLLDIFREKGMEVVAVDLTTPEIREAGFWVVRVLIPEMVPMSPVHAIRFLDTPRLYQAPRAMGYGNRTIRDVTAKPQPFA